MSTHLSFSNAKEEFDEAWHNPAHTPIEPDPVDVNALLQKHYSTSEPLRLTKPMLWDAEAKKAWDPMTYIPRVVREGESWGRKPLENGEECFLRASQQRAWRTDVDGQVLEEVYLSPEERRVLFLSRVEFLRGDGPLRAGSHQPLFHVEHAVGGTDSHPLNLVARRAPDNRKGRRTHPTTNDTWRRRGLASRVHRDLRRKGPWDRTHPSGAERRQALETSGDSLRHEDRCKQSVGYITFI